MTVIVTKKATCENAGTQVALDFEGFLEVRFNHLRRRPLYPTELRVQDLEKYKHQRPFCQFKIPDQACSFISILWYNRHRKGIPDMKRAFLRIGVLLAIVLLCIQHNGKGEETRKLTLMIYMCGSNLESGSGAASLDLEEIKAAGPQPAK